MLKVVSVALLTVYLSTVITKLSNIIFIIVASFILAAALSPIVTWFYKRKVPKTLSIFSIYLLIIGVLYTVIIALVPIAIKQLTNLADYLIRLVEKIQTEGVSSIPNIKFITNYVDEERLLVTLRDTLDLLATKIGNISGSLLQLATSVLSDILSVSGLVITIFVISFYILTNEEEFNIS